MPRRPRVSIGGPAYHVLNRGVARDRIFDQRWHANRHSAGYGPLYQGRFKSFPIQQDEHLLAVCRYVERNAVRAKLEKSAGDWPWCSLSRRGLKSPTKWLLPLDRWPARADSGTSPPPWYNFPDAPSSPPDSFRGLPSSVPRHIMRVDT